MTRISYGPFAAAFGTCWLVLTIFALGTGSNINPGWLGLIGFPVIGLVYALFRGPAIESREIEMRELQSRIKRLEQRLSKIQAESESS